MRISIAILALFAALAAGCSASSRQANDFVPEMSVDLVLPQHELLAQPSIDDSDRVWLVSRNDANLGNLPGSRLAIFEAVDVHHREWLRISNGRPREYTSVYTRSRKVGVAP